jgi:hypothetical protein
MGRGQAEEVLPEKAREQSEVETVRETVDVAGIIRTVEEAKDVHGNGSG